MENLTSEQEKELINLFSNAKVYGGRTTIYSSKKEEELNKETIEEILNDCLPVFYKNQANTRYLNRVYRGYQDIRFKQKEVRETINNVIVENNAYAFVEFKKGFVFGKPIQYVQRDSQVAKELSSLNDYMIGQNKASKDTETAEDMYISGRGFRYISPAKPVEEYDAPFEMHNIESDRCEIIYSSGIGHKQLLSFVETPFSEKIMADGTTIPAYNIYSVYTKNKYYEYKGTLGSLMFVKEENLNIDGHRIYEYYLNKSRMGIIEVVLSLLNAINLLQSNDMDDVQQFVNSFLVFINANIDEDKFAKLKSQGAILIKSTEKLNADVKLLAQTLSKADTQVFYDRLYTACLRILGIPTMTENVTNGSTGQANLVSGGYTMADQRANQDEEMFKRTDYVVLNYILKICKKFDSKHIKKMTIRDIDIKFTRNKSENLLVKTQGLMNLKSAQISPEVALAAVELFPDANEAFLASKQYFGEDLWKEKEKGNGNSKDGVNNIAQMVRQSSKSKYNGEKQLETTNQKTQTAQDEGRESGRSEKNVN